MSSLLKRLGLVAQTLLAVVILALVGWHFYTLLGNQSLQSLSFGDRGWYLLPAGLLYLGAHTIWGTYWWELLRYQGVRVSWADGVRAYFVSQFGKYVPGKVWVIGLRMGLLHGVPGATKLLVGLTATYEALINMAAGAMLAAVLIPATGVGGEYASGQGWVVVGIAALPVGLFLLVRLVNRVTRMRKGPDAQAVANAPLWLLLAGLLQAAVGWCLLALSLRLTAVAVVPGLPANATADLASVTASYVVGFVVLVAPGGLGPREFILVKCLEPRLADAGAAVVIALLLRLVWTAFEVALAGGLYLTSKLRRRGGNTEGVKGWHGEGVRRPGFSPCHPFTPSHLKRTHDMLTRPAPIPDLLSLVIPVYNERDSLQTLHAEIDGAVRGAGLTNVEILFIDDGSRDGSWDMIQHLAGQDTRVHGVRFRKNFGKAAALNIGLRRAAGDVVMTLDADLQDDPKEIPRFMAAVKAGTDVVSGWKQVRYDPWHKVFPSRVFNWMVSKLTGVTLHDHNCGFKAYRGAVIREVRLYGDLHRYVPVLAHEAGFTVGELVINHRPRKFGHSKFGARRFLKGFLDLIAVWFRTTFGYRPMHAFGTAAVLLGGGGILLHLLLVLAPVGNTIYSLLYPLPLLCLVFAAQSVFTGLLAEYVLARSTPDDPYRVAETTVDPKSRANGET